MLSWRVYEHVGSGFRCGVDWGSACKTQCLRKPAEQAEVRQVLDENISLSHYETRLHLRHSGTHAAGACPPELKLWSVVRTHSSCRRPPASRVREAGGGGVSFAW